MIEAHAQRRIDIFRAGGAFLQHPHGFVAEHGGHAAGGEAGGFVDEDRGLADAVRADDREQLPFLDVEAHAAQRRGSLVPRVRVEGSRFEKESKR